MTSSILVITGNDLSFASLGGKYLRLDLNQLGQCHARHTKKGARGKSPDSRNRLKRLKLFSNDIYTIDVIFCELRLDLVDGLLAATFHCDGFKRAAAVEHAAHVGDVASVPTT